MYYTMLHKNTLSLSGPVAFLGSIATRVATPRARYLIFCLACSLPHSDDQIDNTIRPYGKLKVS